MSWQFTPYVFAYLAAGAASLVAALYVWGRRQARAAWPLFIALVAEVEWAWTGAAAMSHADLAGQFFFVKLSYLGIVSLPPASFAFSLVYSGREQWLSRRTLMTLVAIPLITLLLLITNDAHGLMYKHMELATIAGFAKPVVVRGPWFWVHAVFSYTLVVSASFLLILSVVEAPSPYRYQIALVVFGSLIPLAGNLLQVMNWNPLPVDITPIAFSAGSSAIALAVFHYRLFDLMPVARSIVIDGLADGVLVLDAKNRVIDANAGALRILARDSSAVVGRPARDVLSAFPRLVEQFGDVAQGEAEIALEVEGGEHHYALRFSPILAANGAILGRVVVARDITDRIRLIRELEAYSRVVAHDLKSPIAVVHGYAALLEANVGNTLDESNRKYLADAVRGCERMIRIVDELLLFARVRGAEKIAVAPVNMAEVVAEAKERLSKTLTDANAVVLVPREWPTALGNAAWVEEVWASYISNAIKYGGAPPRVELGAENISDGMVRFWVRDNGSGIAPQDVDRLFREFSRLGKTSADSHGLGLSIVKRIVERLGGSVGVASTLGEGSTFWFTLPSANDETDGP
ncbi:MAG TPA: histidine kinase N-terminal 7TM domain-containing protein [Candidatus Acidoferrales bacterium]|nr:histidine kinase N-terminal 7TM domain-containing protein [Candidatus Acidoferrales bacterium]